MMKQAFLIIAHGDFALLQKLILTLESPEVDIFVHIDAKVKSVPDLYVSGESSLSIFKDRIDTRWGDFSQIATELLLLEKSYQKGCYSHYHIISGTHFPIKPVDEIISYFETMKGKTVFCGLCQSTPYQETMKLRHYNLFTRRLAYGSAKSRIMFQKLWRVSNGIQEFLKIRRNKGVVFYKASNWVSLSEDAVEYLLQNRKCIERVFHWSFCGDEYFAPTLLMASPLAECSVSNEMLLKQEMGEANPRVFTNEDYDSLVGSDCFFARKFSETHIDVVDRIAVFIKN